MTELAERSGGMWRPSPGSVYPVLQQLQDEGLVVGEDRDGRRVFSLTDAGRRHVAENPAEFREPWASTGMAGSHQQIRDLFENAAGLTTAAREVVRQGSAAQIQQAVEVIDHARRSMYRILAGDPVGDPRPEWGTPESGDSGPADVQDAVPPTPPSAPEASGVPEPPSPPAEDGGPEGPHGPTA